MTVRLAVSVLLITVLASCQPSSTTAPGTTAQATTTVPATSTTTLAWDSAEAVQRVATYCGVAAGDLSPVTSTPEAASYAPNAFSGRTALATVDPAGRISCMGFDGG